MADSAKVSNMVPSREERVVGGVTDSLASSGLPVQGPTTPAVESSAPNIEHELLAWGALIEEHEPNVPLAYPAHREMLLPAYVAMVVKSLRNINAQSQTIDMSFTLVVRINFGGFPTELREECTRALAFRFNEAPLVYEADHVDARWRGSLFIMTARIQMSGVVFVGEAFDYAVWSEFPFDEPALTFRLEFTSHTIESDLLKGWKVRYNIHEYLGPPDERSTLTPIACVKPMMSFKSNADALPAFDVQMDRLSVSLTAEKKVKEGVTFVYNAVVTFHIPLFRHPGSSLSTMVFPLLVTDVGILMIMFMAPDKYEDRVGSLITVLLALFAFLNFARSTLPDVPVSTWLDVQIFISVTMSLCAMLETVLAKYEYATDDTLKLSYSHLTFGFDESMQLSHGQMAMRAVRTALLAAVVLGMITPLFQLVVRYRRYRKRATASRDAQLGDLKKRSTDFDDVAYGLRAFEDVEPTATRSLTTRPSRRQQPFVSNYEA